jgi:hypothetical protein
LLSLLSLLSTFDILRDRSPPKHNRLAAGCSYHQVPPRRSDTEPAASFRSFRLSHHRRVDEYQKRRLDTELLAAQKPSLSRMAKRKAKLLTSPCKFELFFNAWHSTRCCSSCTRDCSAHEKHVERGSVKNVQGGTLSMTSRSAGVFEQGGLA